MTATINASNGTLDSNGGIVFTGDNSGLLALQTNYTTLVTLANGIVTVSAGLVADSAEVSGPLDVSGAATFSGSATFSSDATFSSTGAVKIPVGTTAQQPSPSSNGMLRYNSEEERFEGYSGGSWGSLGGGASSITSAKLYFFAGI